MAFEPDEGTMLSAAAEIVAAGVVIGPTTAAVLAAIAMRAVYPYVRNHILQEAASMCQTSMSAEQCASDILALRELPGDVR